MRMIMRFVGLALVTGLAACNDCGGIIGKVDRPTVNLGSSTTTCERALLLTGTKQSATGIEVNGDELVPLDDQTSWQARVELEEGSNELSIKAVDGQGHASEAVNVTVVADLTPPSFTVSETEALVFDPTYVMEGTRDADANIWVNGELVAAADGSETWSATLTLEMGDNVFRVAAQDACNESAVVTVNVVLGDQSFTVDRPPAYTNDPVITVTGYRAEGVEVWVGIDSAAPVPELAAATRDGTWQVEVDLGAHGEGSHPVCFEGRAEGKSPIKYCYTIVYDVTRPAAPVLDELPDVHAEPVAFLNGTKEGYCALWAKVNGGDAQQLTQNTPGTQFSGIEVPLVEGNNLIEVWCVDQAGNTSDSAFVDTYYGDVVVLIDPPIEPDTDTNPLVIGGTKEEEVEVTVSVNGETVETIAPGDDSWSVTITLVEGVNTIVIEGKVGEDKVTQTVTVVYMPDPPDPCVIDVPAVVGTAFLDVNGTKGPRTGVEREGKGVVVPISLAESFVDPRVPLDQGENILRYRCFDRFGRSSEWVTVTVTLDPDAPTLQVFYPRSGRVVNQSFEIIGRADDEMGVQAVEARIGRGEWQGAPLTPQQEGQISVEFRLPFDATGQTDGRLVDLELRATDTVGNVSLTYKVPVYLILAAKPISSGPDMDSLSKSPSIAAGQNRAFYAAYDDNSIENDSDIYLSVQDGQAFDRTSRVLISDNNTDFADCSNAKVALDDGGLVHVMFQDDGPLVENGLAHRIFNAAANPPLQDATHVVVSGADEAVLHSDLAAGPGGMLAAVWTRGSPSRVELAIYDGATWQSSPIHVNAAAAGVSSRAAFPRVAIHNDGVVHVVWMDRGTLDGDAVEDADIYYRRYTEGQGLSDMEVVTRNELDYRNGDAQVPAISAEPFEPFHTIWVSWIEWGRIKDADGAWIEEGTPKVVARTVSDSIFDEPLPGLGSVYLVTAAQTTQLSVSADEDGSVSFAWAEMTSAAGAPMDFDVFVGEYLGGLRIEGRHLLSVGSDPVGNTTALSRDPVVARDNLGNSHVLWWEQVNIAGSITTPDDFDVVYMAIGEPPPD